MLKSIVRHLPLTERGLVSFFMLPKENLFSFFFFFLITFTLFLEHSQVSFLRLLLFSFLCPISFVWGATSHTGKICSSLQKRRFPYLNLKFYYYYLFQNNLTNAIQRARAVQQCGYYRSQLTLTAFKLGTPVLHSN